MSADVRHTVHELFAAARSVEPYPVGVVGVPEQIHGTSFFPGGTGLWVPATRELPAFPFGRVMVLGHDFHNVAGYEWSRKNELENLRSPTWRHLLDVLKQVRIAPENCFFTNVYMGLRAGKKTTGTFAGSKSPDFVERCRRFFVHQVEVQRPSLLLALGAHVPRFLAPLASQLSGWQELDGFPARDAADLSLIDGVRFGSPEAEPCVVVSLVHPSFRPRNVGMRRWKDLLGEDAEVGMAQHALALSERNRAGGVS